MEAISKQFIEEYDRGLKQNALVPLNGRVNQLDSTTVKTVKVGSTSYSPSNGVVTLPEYSGGISDVSYDTANKKITKTVGDTTSDVVTVAKLKTDMGLVKGDVGLGNVTNDAQVKRTEMGTANGVATLGQDGKIPSSQLPSLDTTQYTQKVFLEENGGVLTQEMINKANTIYVIQYDYNLNDPSKENPINIPAGCVLEFAGGRLSNGKINSTSTYVKNYTIDCVSNLSVANGFIPMESNAGNTGNIIYTLECFGDYRTDALTVLTLALHNSLNRIVYVNEAITVTQSTALNLVSNYTTLASQNNSKITFTGTVTFHASSYLTIKNIHLHFDTPSQYDQLFVTRSNHVIIENIEMSGTTNTSEGQRYGGGIHVTHSINTTIRNNRIYNVFLNGILVHGDCVYADIVNNYVDGTTNIGIEIEGRSGALGSTEALPCSNITIIGNQLYNCADCGININFSNTINIVGNIVKYTRMGLNCISCQDVAISSNYVISNGSALLIDQEFFGDIDLTNKNISVSNNTFSGGISNNLTGKGKVINALVPIQNAGNIKIINNTFSIHSLVDTRDKDNDCVIAVLSSRYVKILNNQIIGYANELPTKYNTGILIGRSYKVQQTTNYYEVTDELQEIPSDIKIANNTIGYLAYGISTIIPNSTDITPYTDGVENKVNQLQICGNTIKECVYDVNIGRYAVDWKIEDNVLINNTNNNYPSSGTTSETPQIMTGAVRGLKYFDTSFGQPVFWSGDKARGNNGWVDSNGGNVTKGIPKSVAFFGNSLLVGFGYGMAASASDKDYYYLVGDYLKSRYPDVKTGRIAAFGFETAESDEQADSGMWTLLEYIMQNGASAVVIECGDNVNTENQQNYFVQYGAERLLQTIKLYAPNAKIYWVGLWFNKSNVYNTIVQMCNKYNVIHVDIRDLSNYVSAIGAVHKYDEPATYTKQNVTNVAVSGDTLTITFTFNGESRNTSIKCSSHSLSGTTLTFTGYETYIDDYGESIHPSDSGFRLIANRILREIQKDF